MTRKPRIDQHAEEPKIEELSSDQLDDVQGGNKLCRPSVYPLTWGTGLSSSESKTDILEPAKFKQT